MNRLIDALLKFSSMAQIEPNRETVDLSDVAHAVAAELAQAEPARRVEFRITEGMSVIGDCNLLRVVLDNLLGNAWKYTGTREKGAIIEFGITKLEGRPTYFVRDNGAGFDMAAADKLFLPFHRLPGAEGEEGYGIGLSTVERIITRLGGRVWAEGEKGKGSIFYFTLSGDRVSI
jgi:light-regulated signal transduction histidine kinase (bacteriophytochrome)